MSAHEAGPTAVVPAVSVGSLACLRALGRRGVETVVAADARTRPEFRSRYCDERALVPDPFENLTGYRDALLELVREPKVRTVTPMREADAYVLSRYYDAFEEHVTPVWPTFEGLEGVHDRVRLVETARNVGVSTPETELLDEVEDWDRELVVKPRYALLTPEYTETDGIRSPGSARFLDPGVEPDRETIYEQMGHVPIVQEYVPGKVYAFWALCDRGEAVAACQRVQLRGYKYAASASVYRRTVDIPELDAAGRALVDGLDWHGMASIQFIRDEDTGAFELLEFNPRFWGSLHCAIRAGLNLPYHYFRVAGGETIEADPGYQLDVGTHLLRGELVHLHSVLTDEYPVVDPPRFSTRAREVLTSLYEQPNFDYLSLDDPRPFTRDVVRRLPGRRQTVSALIGLLSGTNRETGTG
jgi:predicted ATP-grasp superfamily ATP-dependent carboligase